MGSAEGLLYDFQIIGGVILISAYNSIAGLVPGLQGLGL